MTKEIILETIRSVNKKGKHLVLFLKKNHPDIMDEIMSKTKFLDEAYAKFNETPMFRARLYCIENDITEIPTCQNPDCHSGKPPRWDYGKGQFKRFCSCECRDEWFREVSSKDLYREQINDACERKYGNRNIFRSRHFKEESEKTCLKNHGVKHISLSKEWRDGVKETCRRKYHADSPFESEEIQDKSRKTCLENNGVENPFNSSEFQKKARETMRRNHNGKVGYAAKDIMEKACATSEERYGYEHYTQSLEYHKNKKHKFHSEKYPGLTFDSKWEVKVYEFCKDNNIPIEYSPTISYEYMYDGRIWTYHPDFLINGKVFEVKGDNFFRINESTGEEEMFCPYGRKKLGEEKWAWLCGKFEAKHQCMLKNNVPILRNRDIKNLCVEMFVS